MLVRYKSQTLVSVAGLAIGFTAFTFTMSWIRYETGYDSHNPDKDRIFRVVQVDSTQVDGLSAMVPDPLANYLSIAFPEIEAATFVRAYKRTIEVNQGRDSIENVRTLLADTSFFHVFYPEIKFRFPVQLSQPAQIQTATYNEKLSRWIEEKSDYLLGTIPEQNMHSNVAFDHIDFTEQLSPDAADCPWCYGSGGEVYIRVHKNGDIASLKEKLNSLKFEREGYQMAFSFKLFTLQEAHYKVPNSQANIKFTHLKIFALVSLLVILCGLFNYIMLFVNRIKLRSRELALRKVNASSNAQLISLLLTEFLVVLLLALIMGGVLSEWLFPLFLKLSQIDAPKLFFIREAGLYSLVIVIISMLAVIIPASYFMQRSVRENIHPETNSSGGIKNRFTMTSIFVQLTVGSLLMFCTFIFLYQFHFLNTSDIGFNRHNIATIGSLPIGKNELKSLPNIHDAVHFNHSFLPALTKSGIKTTPETDAPGERTQHYEVYLMDSPDFLDFFEIKLIEGRNLRSSETNACLINETARRLMGNGSPIGRKLGNWTIMGVISDLKINSPLLPVHAAIYTAMDMKDTNSSTGSYAYRFEDGKRQETEQTLQNIIKEKSQSNYPHTFRYMDDEFSNYTKSERYLLILLSCMTATAILIAIFGIYSMITLTCNQRRKEIAIRKVNGARVHDIFALLFRDYIAITVAACIVSFLVGMYIMQHWLEQYTRHISIGWWLYTGIFLLILSIVSASIFFRVWKSASENPVEAMKSN